jgi:hypothetical protein
MSKNLSKYERDTSQGKINHFLRQFLLLATRISRKLWWTNQEFSPVNVIPPWFMLIYQMGAEK